MFQLESAPHQVHFANTSQVSQGTNEDRCTKINKNTNEHKHEI